MTSRVSQQYSDHPEYLKNLLKDLSHDRPPLPWDTTVERLLNGLREPHLYIGRAIRDGVPWLLLRKLLHTHAHILGGTGTGKTALALLPLIYQLIARADASVVILDLKLDKNLFWGSFIEAERAGLPFKWFTLEPGCASYAFNPLTQSHDHERTLNGRAQSLLTSMGLYYGEGYGTDYWQSFSLDTFTAFLAKFKDIRSFADLSRYAEQSGSYAATNTDEKNSQLVRMVLRQLATVAPLNVSVRSRPAVRPEVLRDAIDFTDILTRKQVVYFGLPSMEEQLTAKSIGKQVPYGLVHAAQVVSRKMKSLPVHVIVDEAQQVLGENTKILLEMARSLGVYFILAHQSIDQLRNSHWDITGAIEANTTFKMTFEASSIAALKAMQATGGETREPSASWVQRLTPGFNENDDEQFSIRKAYPRKEGEATTATISDLIRPTFDQNRILAISADSLKCFVRSRTDGGLTQYAGRWTEIECEFPTTQAEYDARKEAPFPSEHPSCVTIPVPWSDDTTPDLSNDALPIKPPAPSVDRAIAERLKELQNAIRNEHRQPPSGP